MACATAHHRPDVGVVKFMRHRPARCGGLPTLLWLDPHRRFVPVRIHGLKALYKCLDCQEPFGYFKPCVTPMNESTASRSCDSGARCTSRTARLVSLGPAHAYFFMGFAWAVFQEFKKTS